MSEDRIIIVEDDHLFTQLELTKTEETGTERVIFKKAGKPDITISVANSKDDLEILQILQGKLNDINFTLTENKLTSLPRSDEATSAPRAAKREDQKPLVHGKQGVALTVNERKQIMHMLDMNKNKVRKYTCVEIASIMGKHPKTIQKFKKIHEAAYNLYQSEHDNDNNSYRTTEIPVAGKQGGFRYCRMNGDQQALCAR